MVSGLASSNSSTILTPLEIVSSPDRSPNDYRRLNSAQLQREPPLTVSHSNCFSKFTIAIIFNQRLNELQIPRSTGYDVQGPKPQVEYLGIPRRA